MTNSDHRHSDNCSHFLGNLDAWLAEALSEPASALMQSHHDSCPQCQTETRLAREIDSITRTLPEQACPPLKIQARTKAVPPASVATGQDFLSRLFAAWKQPLVYVPALALLVMSAIVIPNLRPDNTGIPDVVTINGQDYTREEILEATQELEIALQYLDKYGSYPARVLRTELRESHLPLPPPRDDATDPAI